MHEECGVFGIWSPEKRAVSREVYLGLYALQHRGQESCGIAVSCDGCFTGRYPIDIPEDQGKSRFEQPIVPEGGE